MKFLDEIRKAWGWTGLEPTEIIQQNEFANFILKDSNGKFWRLCPEAVYCKIIASSVKDYDLLIKDEDFLEDWLMKIMVEEAKNNLGSLMPGYSYYMEIPGPLGGEYGGRNVKTAPTVDIIKFSGVIGAKTKEAKLGDKIEFRPIS